MVKKKQKYPEGGGSDYPCPYCHCDDTKVIDSRFSTFYRRRRRYCTACKERFTTHEVLNTYISGLLEKEKYFDSMKEIIFEEIKQHLWKPTAPKTKERKNG